MMLAKRKHGCESGMSFAWDDSYKVLRKRLERIVERKAYNPKALSAGTLVILII